MVMTITGIVLMIIASLLYYVTVQEIRQIKHIVETINKTHDAVYRILDNTWKKIAYMDNDINRAKIQASNAARNADEALKKVSSMSFGDYIPKHGKEDSE